MKKVALIFPHQLFEKNPALKVTKEVFLIEEYLFFRQYKFHKQKLLFHRATMKYYEEFLKCLGFNVNYIESSSDLSDIRFLIEYLGKINVKEIHFIDVVDNWLEKRIRNYSQKFGINLVDYPSPSFLNSKEEIFAYFKGKQKFFQTDFYIKQRKKFKLLLNSDLTPIGGKWSFDGENRLRYPTKKSPPKIEFPQINNYYREAIDYVNKNFPDNYGQINTRFIYPTTHKESKLWLNQFIEKRFFEFGHYEDAIVAEEHILHHSVLSPLMNVGFLTPQFILNEVLRASENKKIPLNSLEGFIRQLIGWREFIRGVYEVAGSYQRTKNFWNFRKKMSSKFYTGTTDILPVDLTIQKVLATGYAHHIERLMVLGNFMLLCEFDPDEVYKWFMEMFIDAYDWVMVPNVYGMSQFADGGLMSTKPYISGSNYLKKMSNYKNGEWQKIWDGLFWRFISKHRTLLSTNPRISILINNFDKMNDSKKSELINLAEDLLRKIN